MPGSRRSSRRSSRAGNLTAVRVTVCPVPERGHARRRTVDTAWVARHGPGSRPRHREVVGGQRLEARLDGLRAIDGAHRRAGCRDTPPRSSRRTAKRRRAVGDQPDALALLELGLHVLPQPIAAGPADHDAAALARPGHREDVLGGGAAWWTSWLSRGDVVSWSGSAPARIGPDRASRRRGGAGAARAAPADELRPAAGGGGQPDARALLEAGFACAAAADRGR